MRKIAIMLACLTLNACAQPTIQTHFVAQQKGEKQMATLIKAERWVGNNITEVRNNIVAGGWRGDTNGFVNSYHLERDAVLGNVLYEQWTTGSGGSCPNGGCNTIAYDISPSTFENGVTFHGYVKFYNIVNGRMGSHWHTGVRGNTASYTGNGGSQLLMEHGVRGGRGPDNGFFVMTTGGGGERVVTGGSSTGYLRDDVWYEFVWYIHRPSQLQRIHYRPIGTTEWTQVLNATNGNLNRSSDPWLGFGPYIHGYNTSWGTKRVYYGPCNFYAGDAYNDGDIGEGTEPGPGPDPEPSDPLAISNHKVKASDTSAALTWDTNKPSNTVVDYGPTEARGTIVRDDNNTTEHVAELTDLTPNTAYYYRFSSRTTDGETVMDQANSTFMTKTTDNGGGIEPEPTEVALNDLTDVTLVKPEEGQVLVYKNGQWVNGSISIIVDEAVRAALKNAKISIG